MRNLFTSLTFLLLVGLSHGQAQQFTVDTLQKTGPINRRINVVILGDGFTQSELPKFDAEARKFVAFFLGYKPYDAYRNYFNFFSIRVPSNESGATNPGTAPDRYPKQPVEKKDTYFGSSFGTANIHRLVAITKRPAFTNVMAQNFPSYDLAILIVNSTWYGGSGGNPATFTLNEQASLIGVHEIGHQFSSLADEYWSGPWEAANETRNNNLAAVVWKNWLNQFGVGIFQHTGDADAVNWYKPTTHNCLMEQLDKPFCAVCREATTNRILQLVKPVETVLPAPESRVLVDARPAQFQLGLLPPEPNTLRIEWRLNGALLNQKTAQVSISNSQLPNPVNALSVSVFDSTDYIRLASHPQQHTYTYRWTLENPKAVPVLTASASKTALCTGDTTMLTAQNCAGTITWSTGATSATVLVSPTQSTTYSAVCAVANAASQTAVVAVSVSPLPTAEAGNTGPYREGQTIQLTANGGVTYRWNGPGNYTTTEQNPAIKSAKISQAGAYTVAVTSANGCVNTAQTNVAISPLLATPIVVADAVWVFPNPTGGLVQIRSSLPGEQSVRLLDATGREVFKKSFYRSTEINTENLPDKLYFY